jgi:hypothetical protein
MKREIKDHLIFKTEPIRENKGDNFYRQTFSEDRLCGLVVRVLG